MLADLLGAGALDWPAQSALARAHARSRRLGRPILVSWTRPAPSLDALAFFAQAEPPSERALWLQPARAEALVGLGSAAVLEGHGAERFAQIGRAWRDLLADAVIDPEQDASVGPLLQGGFSFDPLGRPSAAWRGFPDGRMVLPARMLSTRAGVSWLTTNVLVDATGLVDAAADARPPTLARPYQPTQALAFARSKQAPPEQAVLADHEQPPLSAKVWKSLVGSVARGIRHGQLGLEKVVLARAKVVNTDTPLDPAPALRTLAASYPSCTVFAVSRDQACFLGATPERLVALRHGSASTMALAGSIRRGGTPDEDVALASQLLRDPKERGEHAVVVGALRAGLARDGLCTRVVADAQPRVSRLPNVQHLLTPIRGQAAPGTTLLDLIERLHPTPAVGGFPRQRALELIRAYEALDRGWYAGPIGWLDRHGEGEFVVGIRSALVHGTTAMLFAGCGIVADSNPAAEYAESGWKLQPMLAALGVDGER